MADEENSYQKMKFFPGGKTQMSKYRKKGNVVCLAQFELDFILSVVSPEIKVQLSNFYSKLKSRNNLNSFKDILCKFIASSEIKVLHPWLMTSKGKTDIIKDDLTKYGVGLFECCRRLQMVKAGDIVYLNSEMEEKGEGWFVYQDGMFCWTLYFINKTLPVEAAFQSINSQLDLDGFTITCSDPYKFLIEDCNGSEKMVKDVKLGGECSWVYLVKSGVKLVLQKMECECEH